MIPTTTTPTLIGIQIGILHELAVEHGHEGNAALRWCVREGLVEEIAGGAYQVTAAGRIAVHRQMLTPRLPAPPGRERPRIVIARSIREARAAAAH